MKLNRRPTSKMIRRAITYEEAERVAFAKSEVIAQDSSLPLANTQQYSPACWIYLAGIAVATFGWLWFLARIALRLLQPGGAF